MDNYQNIIQKEIRIDAEVLRASADGQECTFQFPGICNHDKETTVLCHSGALDDGKGWALKGNDLFAAFGCSACHAYFDNKANNKCKRGLYFHRAMKRTWRVWFELGLIKIADILKDD